MAQKDWLGQDTEWPIEDKFSPTKGIDEVNQCLEILISTIPGERVMRPDYGCALFTRIWENIDKVASEGLQDIRVAIETFEPRVQLVKLSSSINRDQGSVVFRIQYRLVDENNVRNLVFPFQTRVR